MYIVKHCRTESYFCKRSDHHYGDLFTSKKSEAKRFKSLVEALNIIEWFQDENYMPFRVYELEER